MKKSRKAYTQPKLLQVGSVAEVTKTNDNVSITDVPFGQPVQTGS